MKMPSIGVTSYNKIVQIWKRRSDWPSDSTLNYKIVSNQDKQ